MKRTDKNHLVIIFSNLRVNVFSLQTLGSNSIYGYLAKLQASLAQKLLLVIQLSITASGNITELLKVPEFRGLPGLDGPAGEVGPQGSERL